MTILIFVHLIVLLALGFLLWRRSVAPLRLFLWPAYLLKLAAGIGVGLLYSIYYSTGDTMHYFRDGMLLADLARHDTGSLPAVSVAYRYGRRCVEGTDAPGTACPVFE